MNIDWQPLESNPEVLNNYLRSLQFDTNEFEFTDLFSVEDWAQEMISQPVLGVLLNFPYSSGHLTHKKFEDDQIKKNGQYLDPDLFFVNQKAENSCGTIAMFHIVTNLGPGHQHLINDSSIAMQFKKLLLDQSSQERGERMAENAQILESHVQSVQKSEAKPASVIENHFSAFICFKGNLYEMDGTKSFPVNHGPTSEQTFLADVCKIMEKFMQREPENMNFSILVLARKNIDVN